MRVLICGHRSFTAQGLSDLLQDAGHEVLFFSRGPVARQGSVITGPVDAMHENLHLLDASIDVVVNYILLMGESVGRNIEYIQSLLEYCRLANVPHLVHISSLSAYASSLKFVDEEAEIEPDPAKKGIYGALKAATDNYIREHQPPNVRVSMVRPAFVLAPGLKSPISGNAIRLPWGHLLTIGNPHSQFPLITRELLNESLVRLIQRPGSGRFSRFLVAAPNSPTREEYLRTCCTALGCGRGVTSLPAAFWLLVVLIGALAARTTGVAVPKLRNRVPRLRIDPRHTEQSLGISLQFDWRSELLEAVGAQEQNYPLRSVPQREFEAGADTTASIAFLGFGRIVHTRHLPALERLGFGGRILAYDLTSYTSASGVEVKAVADASVESANLYVVATPGPAHIEAIPILEPTSGPILVEKPLAYTPGEFETWRDFASHRQSPIFVCHNYRFKKNVLEMLDLMRRFNPGRLLHVHVHFESPPVSNDPAIWIRNERVSRSLLMDYSIHLLDIACSFGRGQWRADAAHFSLSPLGQTSVIEGTLQSDNYAVSFLLRQGFSPRHTRLLFDFQNYRVALGFAPDTCFAYMANDNPISSLQEAQRSAGATVQKVIDVATSRQSDQSHATVIAHALTGDEQGVLESLRVENLESFYRAMFQLSDMVYGKAAAPVAGVTA